MGSWKTFATIAWVSKTFTFLPNRKVWEVATCDFSLMKSGLTTFVCGQAAR